MSVLASLSPERRFVLAKLCREDLYAYACWIFHARRGTRWLHAPHHPLICDALMRVFNGECKRLIINIPPRYSKSSLAVMYFITWSLGRAPDAEFIHTSYSGRLAASNAWQARDIVLGDDYRLIFPHVRLRQDSTAKDEWRTTAGGCVYAVGAGGAITGYGAGKLRSEFGGAIIIDDPNKPEDARSDIMRTNMNEWFSHTLESRANSKDTPIILIMQRLHEEDLSGFLLAGGNGEHWEHICLPAIQADGSALWPEKHSIDVLRRMQEATPYTFAAQYLQSPAPPTGGIFKPDAIEYRETAHGFTRWIRAWDLAATQDDGDWTVGMLLGEDPQHRYMIADVVRIQGSPDRVEQAIVATAHRDGRAIRISLPKDPGQAGAAQTNYLTRQLAGYPVFSTPESGDKITRAEPFAAQVNIGNVSCLRAEWNHALISEMRNFPFAKYDDQIDAGSRAFSELAAGRPFDIPDKVLAWAAQKPRF